MRNKMTDVFYEVINDDVLATRVCADCLPIFLEKLKITEAEIKTKRDKYKGTDEKFLKHFESCVEAINGYLAQWKSYFLK